MTEIFRRGVENKAAEVVELKRNEILSRTRWIFDEGRAEKKAEKKTETLGRENKSKAAEIFRLSENKELEKMTWLPGKREKIEQGEMFFFAHLEGWIHDRIF